MADQREVAWQLGFRVDNSGLDQATQAQQNLDKATEQTVEHVDQMGTKLGQVGSQAAGSLGQARQVGAQMGTTVRTAMSQSAKAGDSLGQVLKTGIGTALTNAKNKAVQFGTSAKQQFAAVGTSIAHPVQAIKSKLITAMDDAGDSTEELGEQADKTGTKLNDMGGKGDGAGSKIASAVKRIVTAFAAAAVIGTAVNYIKDFCGAAITAAATAEETQSKFDVVFGDMSETTMGWVDNFSAAAHRKIGRAHV